MPLDRHDILMAARQYLGCPFQHQGRFLPFPDGTHGGGDCVGLILRVAWDLGIPLEDWTGYPRSTNGTQLTRECARQLVAVPLEVVQPGDLVQWADARSPNSPPCNIALVGDGPQGLTLIHARIFDPARGTGYVVEHGWRMIWRRLAVAGYAFPGEILPWFALVQEG